MAGLPKVQWDWQPSYNTDSENNEKTQGISLPNCRYQKHKKEYSYNSLYMNLTTHIKWSKSCRTPNTTVQ